MTKQSPAPMRFLERLVPSTHGAGSGVRAALAPRFAPRTGSQDTRGEPDRDALAAGHPSPQHAFAATPSQVAPQQAGGPSSNDAFTPPVPMARTPSTPGRGNDNPPPASISKAAAPVAGSASSAASDATESGATPWHTSQLPLRQRDTQGVHAAPASAQPGLPQVAPPLSESTLAQRIAPARTAETPTVVHVTIDRIDVRTPSATAAQARPQAKPRAASAMSLGDYLRQRDRARHGGSS